MAKHDQQRRLEQRMIEAGRISWEKKINDARAKGRATTIGAAKIMMQQLIDPMAELLRRHLAHHKKRRMGRPVKGMALLQKVPPAVAAYIAAKTVVDSVTSSSENAMRGGGSYNQSTNTKYVRVAQKVGSMIEDEARFGLFRQMEPELFDYITRKFTDARSQSYQHKRTVMGHHMKEAGLNWERSDAMTLVHIGRLMINFLIEARGVVQLEKLPTGYNSHKWEYHLKLTPEAAHWIESLNGSLDMPLWLPMIDKPAPWTDAHHGGYQTIALPLVKSRDRAHQQTLAQTEMPQVLETTNALQETGWRINQFVLTVAKALADSGQVEDVLVNRVLLPLPPRMPEAEAKDEEKFREHKQRIFSIRAENRIRETKAKIVDKALRLAEEYREADAFYFPYQLCWRGRAYTLPAGLSPQGGDLERGLLEFADGVAPGEDGIAWLAIHGANCWGNDSLDKQPLEDRINWVGEHWDEIVAVAADPLGNRWWHEADKPWQFLAFCFEWALFDTFGDEFESHLPVHMDGSCNGLQHFSAMLRDEVGGRAVNLVPQDHAADVYSEVLARLTEKVARIASGHGATSTDDAVMAKRWLDSGLLERKLVKRSVMTLPYGVSYPGTQEQLYNDVVRDAVRKRPGLFGEEDRLGRRHIGWLNKYLWESIREVVVGGLKCMQWLQKAAGLVADENLPIYWTAPSGFPVKQRKPKGQKRQIRGKIAGKVRRINVLMPKGNQLDKAAMKTGIAPNFVHSLDAAHQCSTVVRCREAGIPSFAMVHDSYGCHAGHAPEMARHLREAFVALYEENDPLEEFRDAVLAVLSNPAQLPPLPKRGSLEIRDVLESDFFFA